MQNAELSDTTSGLEVKKAGSKTNMLRHFVAWQNLRYEVPKWKLRNVIMKLGHVSRQKSEAGSAEEAPASNPSSRLLQS